MLECHGVQRTPSTTAPPSVEALGAASSASPGLAERALDFARSWQAALIAVLAVVAIVHIPTFDYWFYNDDYVPFAEIARADSSWDYIWRLLTVQDITPNWRVMPGLVYLAGYKTFGMDPLPYHFVSTGFHLGTCALIFHLLRRVTGQVWAAVLGAIIFGLNPAHVFTVAQITSLNNVQGAFFAVATLVAVYESTQATSMRARGALYAAAIVSFICAIASNESMAVLAPVYALTFLFWDGQLRWIDAFKRATVRSLPIIAIGGAALLSFFACGCNEASSTFFGSRNVGDNALIYPGGIAYPTKLESLTEPADQPAWLEALSDGVEPVTGQRLDSIEPPHFFAAIAVFLLMAIVAIRGPNLARIGALFMVLALVPYLYVQVFAAPRYTYQAVAGFAIFIPSVLASLHLRAPPDWRSKLVLAGAPMIALLAAWYAWQSNELAKPYKADTDEWERITTDVARVFPDVPPNSQVVIIGGPWNDVIYQFHVMPSIAHVTWDPSVRMYSVPPEAGDAEIAKREDNWLIARYEGDESGGRAALITLGGYRSILPHPHRDQHVRERRHAARDRVGAAQLHVSHPRRKHTQQPPPHRQQPEHRHAVHALEPQVPLAETPHHALVALECVVVWDLPVRAIGARRVDARHTQQPAQRVERAADAARRAVEVLQRDDQPAARRQRARTLRQECRRIAEMVERTLADDAVERPVGERQSFRRPPDDARRPRFAAKRRYRTVDQHPRQVDAVQRDALTVLAQQRQQLVPVAAADIEHSAARTLQCRLDDAPHDRIEVVDAVAVVLPQLARRDVGVDLVRLVELRRAPHRHDCALPGRARHRDAACATFSSCCSCTGSASSASTRAR